MILYLINTFHGKLLLDPMKTKKNKNIFELEVKSWAKLIFISRIP